ncbi:MAG TPA: DJ-1/PfpI family protein [Ignavibacteriaceae bacterium]|jgi:putative intracellular protease/amidase|nr:DJ-1/PfpI family protein [Ignavibacteriaceae bacterium]
MKNVKIIFIVLTHFLLGAECHFCENIKVLLILPQNYGLNTHLSREMFDAIGWDVTIAGVDSLIQPCTYSSPQGSGPFKVDVIITEIGDISQYDCIVISSMSWSANPPAAYNDLLNSIDLINLLKTANSQHIVIAATCAGTRVLAAANIINGKKVTGKAGPNNYYINEYLQAGAIFVGENIPPVVDGNIVTTSRGQYYMKQNSEALMIAIQNSKINRKSNEVQQ